MNSILPKHEDLEIVGQKVAFDIFMEGMKKCSKCGEVKSLGEFGKQKNSIDGFSYRCKKCVNFEAYKRRMKVGVLREFYKSASNDEIEKRYNKFKKDEIADKLRAYHKVYNEAKRSEHIEQLKKIIKPNTDGKWIYIMKCGVFYKIGISNDPLRRVKQIKNNTQAPTELIYLAKANYGRTIDTEQIIHHELSSMNVPMPYANGEHKDHVSREWFFGSLDKMVEIVSQYATISEIY